MVLSAVTFDSEHESPGLFGIGHGKIHEESCRPYLVLHFVAQIGQAGCHLLFKDRVRISTGFLREAEPSGLSE